MLGSSCLVSLIQKENNEVTCDKTCKLSMLIFLQSSAIFWICKATFQRNLALCFSYAIAVCTTRLNKDVLALSVKFSFFFQNSSPKMSFPSCEMFKRACEISNPKHHLKIRTRNNFWIHFTPFRWISSERRDKKTTKKSTYFNQKVPDETH